ncbi:hypothetical protein BCR41DRAFT_51294 [Lobosporangium transversale]|uniref:Uncharacterized protein n=1 Tax=Lobosporangium transversale TaxID=64571 RepID=A0A1Y2GTQ7_9FUNG|nr:hypothetical protein BCR41DRAFT_51294 [Lobosporangium transversale]ORZ17593.1 hypothetical protein BCR41DRAFT_51294 [Lobosporangium transversale]|eukprot:XP_021881980.1 hypothetical protein BCR41DRAFT_51294 [Lobosporangium transversale]
MSRPQSVNTVDTPVHDLASSPPNPSDASQTDPVLSPPNQPRRSLSTHLSPDYHSWVTDVSSPSQGPTSSSPAVPTVPSASRFLDAVTGRSKAQQGRIRRENQPSFNGSTFTNSDNEASREHDSEYGNNNDNNDNDDEDANDNGDDSSKDNKDIVQQQDPILPTRSSNGRSSRGYGATNTSSQDPSLSTTVAPLSSNYGFNDTTDAASTPRLPPLSQSRVQVPDRTRPAYKMGAPITTKQRPNKQRTPSTSPTSEPDHDRADQPTETSALLGGGGRDNQNRTRNPQGDREERWTNEGSRRRVARYDGANQQGILDQYMTDENGMDSLRRPSR